MQQTTARWRLGLAIVAAIWTLGTQAQSAFPNKAITMVVPFSPGGLADIVALSSYSVIPEADGLLGRAPLYAFGDLRPMARYTADPTVLALLGGQIEAVSTGPANDAKVREVIHNAGSPILYQDSPDFEKYVQADVRRMTEVVRKIGKVE